MPGVDLPWLQDTMDETVWDRWAVEWGDVVILDAANNPAGVYNLWDHPLTVADNWNALKAMLLDVESP